MRLRQMFMDEQADQERKLHGHNYDLTMTSEQRALTLLVVGGRASELPKIIICCGLKVNDFSIIDIVEDLKSILAIFFNLKTTNFQQEAFSG